MAIGVKSGTFTVTSGTQTVDTGLGNALKLVLFFMEGPTTSAGSNAGAGMGICAFDGTNRAMATLVVEDGQSPSDANGTWAWSSVVDTVSIFNSNTVGLAADGQTLAFLTGGDAGKFTVAWNGTPGGSYLVHYIAFDDTSVTNATVGNKAMPTATGDDAVTGLGFQPNCVMNFHVNRMRSTENVGFEGASLGFGVAIDDGSATTRSFSFISANGVTTNNASQVAHLHSVTKFLTTLIDGSGSNGEVATLSSFDSGGFTLNFTTAGSASYSYQYIAIEFAASVIQNLQTITLPAGTGSQSYATSSDMQNGIALFFGTALGSTADTRTADAIGFFGYGDAVSSAEGCVAVACDMDCSAAQDADRRLSVTRGVSAIASGGAVLAEGDVSHTATGIDINWSTTNNGGLVFMLALGEAAASPPGPSGMLSTLNTLSGLN